MLGGGFGEDGMRRECIGAVLVERETRHTLVPDVGGLGVFDNGCCARVKLSDG
jgi:hypothetical protein